MAELSKKHRSLNRTTRLFTQADRHVYADILFQEREHAGDETWPALECPEGWSAEAAAVFAEAVFSSIPSRRKTIEENTVPSWLWRHRGQGAGRSEETNVRQIFDRLAGSAAYTAWKQGLFADETEAQIFFDEIRFMLTKRLVSVEPRALATMGLEWAYGMNDKTGDASSAKTEAASRAVDVSNATIDAIVRGIADKTVRARRQKLWPASAESAPVTLRLTDIASDWATTHKSGTRAALDLLSFRHNDGWINIDAMRHAVRLTVILFDLHDAPVDIGFCNLAPLLTALALPYDSDNGRSVAAAISAIVTAEAYATSAELAGLRGSSADFTANRETVLRVLRNHRRAAYGDRNDYEKISVLPVPLMLEHSPDLALIAVAQRRWEDVLQLARQHGLRQTQVTSLTPSPELAILTESAAQGIAPLPSLTLTRPAEGDLFRQEIHPSVIEALTRLGYEQPAIRAITRHIAGTGTLEKGPIINHAALRGRGFDAGAIARVEHYLRYVGDIRVAFTPWIVGEEFCRKALKIPASKIDNPCFDMLRHLGFSGEDIASANAFCYGHGSVKGAKEIRQSHMSVLARADEILSEARIRMAASVQSFISGDAGLRLSLPADSVAEKNEALLLSAWRQGVKSLSVACDAPAVAEKVAKKTVKKIRPSVFLHTQPTPPLPLRRVLPKAGSDIVSMSRGKGKSSPAPRGKRG